MLANMQQPAASRGVAFVAAATIIVLLASAHRYGYHRDELYFLAIGQHPSWGYVDQPPLVPLLAAAMDRLGNGSLTVLRLPSALALSAVVVLAAKVAREFGGGKGAQVLAAVATAVSSFPIAVGHLVSTSTYDLLWWTLLSWLLVRALHDGGRVWLWIGLVAGIALQTKPLVLLFLGCVLLSLIGHRELRSRWPWIAALIALTIWMPNLIWQIRHGLPVLEMSRALSGGSSATSEPRALILPFQLVLAVPIWTLGLWHLWRNPHMKPWRRLALAYGLALLVVLIAGGKPYYVAGFFPLLLAAAAVWTAGRPPKTRRSVAAVIAGFAVVGVLLFLPVLPARWLPYTPIPAINTDAGETIGWPRFVATVADAYYRSGADVVIADNYGEAGAMLHYRPDIPTVSPHNSLYDEGPPVPSAELAVMVGFDEADLNFCDSLVVTDVIDNGLDLDNEEQGESVWLCRTTSDWTSVWPALRHIG